MSEALLLVAEGYEQIAAGIRKMVAAQKDTPKKEEKPVKKAEKKETPVEDTPKDEAVPKEKTVDRKRSVRSLRTSPDQERHRKLRI